MKKTGNLYKTLGDTADSHVYDMVAYERMSPSKVSSMFGIEKRSVLEIVRRLAPTKLAEINVKCVCITMNGVKAYMCSACRAQKYEYIFKWNLRHANAMLIAGRRAEGDEKYRGFMRLPETGEA